MKFDIVILGLAPQGLALLRTFARMGFNVLAVGTPHQVGIKSKCGKIIVIKRLDELKNILKRYISQNTVIHITGDFFLNYLLKNYPEIFFKYKTYPSYETANIFVNKFKTGLLAQRLGIKYPKCYFLNEVDIKKINFPLILKWNVRDKETPFKTAVINSIKELHSICSYFTTQERKSLLLQEYIEGGFDTDISYGGYWENGIEKVGIVVNQKRQYPIGLTSCAIEINNSYALEVRKIAYKILSYVKYEGFVEVECKINPQNKQIYLIEVNPRACGWIKILMDRFVNIVLKGKENENRSKELIWINLVRDIRAGFYLLRKYRNPKWIIDMFKDYLKFPIWDIFDLKDIKPFLWQFRKIFKS